MLKKELLAMAAVAVAVTMVLCAVPAFESDAVEVSDADSIAQTITDSTEPTTIKLMNDIESASQITIPSGKEITIDLNGFNITFSVTTGFVSVGKLTIMDSTATSGPTVSDDYETVTYSAGTISVAGSTTVTPITVAAAADGVVCIESGHIDNPDGMALFAQGDREGNYANHPSIVVNGGYVTSIGFCASPQGSGASVTVNGGVLVSSDNAVLAGNGNEENGGTAITVNGGTLISHITTDRYIACGIYSPNHGTVTVTGGTIYADQGAGILSRAGSLTVTGGTIIASGTQEGWIGDSKNTVPSSAVVLDEKANYSGKDAGLFSTAILGGEFSSDTENTVSEIKSDGNTEKYTSVTGGTFDKAPTEFLADGYALDNDTSKVVLDPAGGAECVATIGDSEFPSLAAAVAAVPANGVAVTITLTGDCLDINEIEISEGQNIILDLAGHKITLSASAGDSDPSTATYTIRNLGELSIIGNGTIESGSDRAIYNGGTLKLDGLTVTGDVCLIAASGSVTTIVDAKIESARMAIQNRGALTIEAGTFSNNNNENYSAITNVEGTLTIRAGTFSSTNTSTVYNYAGATLDIDGGTFSSSMVVLDNRGNATVNGATLNGVNAAGYTVNNTGTLTMADSTVTHKSNGTNIAGCVINGIDDPSAQKTGVATFTNTTFTAEGGLCVYGSNSETTLTGCTMTRTGSAGYDWYDSMVAAGYGAAVNVNDSNFDAGKYGFYVFSSGGTINVDGGTYTSSGGKGLFRLDVDMTKYSSAVAKATIKSGTFTGDLIDSGSTATGTALSVQVSGGSFSEEFDQEYVVDGSGLFQNADGTWGIYESVTVTFQYGSGESKAVEVRKGFPVASEDVPTPDEEGKEYTWKNGDTVVDPYTEPFNASVTLTADAEPVEASYTVTFMDGDDLVGAVRAVDGAVTAPTAPTKDGYAFAGWVSASGDAVDLSSITSDLTLYTSWTLAEPTVTVNQTEGDGVVYVDVTSTHTLGDAVEYTYTLVGADGTPISPVNNRFTVTASGQYTLTVGYTLTSDPTYTGKVIQTVDVKIPSPVDPEPEPTPGGDDDEPGTTPGDDDESLPPIIRPGTSSSSADDDTVTIVACAAAAAVAAILAVFLIYAYRKD